jgi:hypothetical protein
MGVRSKANPRRIKLTIKFLSRRSDLCTIKKGAII